MNIYGPSIAGESNLENTRATGSFTGSFSGDGSNLTGIESYWTLSGSNAIEHTGSIHVGGDAAIEGTLTVQELHLEYISSSIIYESGSTKFGDTLDDIHSFTGSLQVSASNSFFSGSINVSETGSGHFSGSFEGDGSGLTGVGGGTPILYIKDVKGSADSGGDFLSGAWRTRDLNTTEGDTSFLISLSSNQFTLPSGSYHIEASAPAFYVQRHQTALYNVTDSTYDIIGTSGYARDPDGYGHTRSFIVGPISISAQKAFEIRHRCSVTKTGNGFGVNSGFGLSSIYTVVTITKIG